MNLNRNAHLWRARAYRGSGGFAPSGVQGLCPQWGPGAKPLVGVRGASPPLKLTIFRYLEGKLYIKKLTVFNIYLPNQSCKIKAKYCVLFENISHMSIA
jgi:hypothetical protein